MASVWKRLQRVNKRAAKFQYTSSYHRVDLETSPKWKPHKLSVVWTRRSRRVATEPLEWEPSLKEPLKGSVIYSVPENQTVCITLFKDSRNELEDKDWTFVLEDVSTTGKRRRLATCAVNMKHYASLESTAQPLLVTLEPVTHKIVSASIQLTLHCVLLREGHATDEDMQSMASLFSVNNNSDVAVLEDLDSDNTLSLSSTKQMSDLRQQMEEMTQSLTNSDLATPNSVQSLNFDSRTPTAPITPETQSPATPVPETTPLETESKTKETFLSHLTKVALKSEQPKFTSTPNRNINIPEPKNDSFKHIVFKPKTVAIRNLKPLDLKTNLSGLNLELDKEEDLDKTPTADVEKLIPGKFDRDKTPVQDLLEWCQSATREYPACRVTNLTTSFRSGLAFCAIIHHYRPDLIDYSGLQPDDADKNVRIALEASAGLGISQVLTAADVLGRPVPDRLAIMTYLFQLRAHFTGSELQVEQLGSEEAESSYLVGRHDTDGALSRDLFSREVSTRRSRQLGDRPRPGVPDIKQSSGSPPRATTEPLVSGLSAPPGGGPLARTLLHKVLSPDRDRSKPTAKWPADTHTDNDPPPPRPAVLMTRKELTDPFGSDEEDRATDPPPLPVPLAAPAALPAPLTAPPEPSSPPASTTAQDTSTVKSSPPTIQPATTDPLTSLTPPSPPAAAVSPPLASPTPAPPPETPTSTHVDKKSTTPELPKPTPQLLSRHDELKERARQLLAATRKEARDMERMRKQKAMEKEDGKDITNGLRNGETTPPKKMTEEERQLALRMRARRLIADARALSPPPGRVEVLSPHSVMEELVAAGGMEHMEAILSRSESTPSSLHSRNSSSSPDTTEECERVAGGAGGAGSAESRRRSPLQSFAALVDRLTPDKELSDESREGGSYIASELEALEREQATVDERAAALEKRLRLVMQAQHDQEEGQLIQQWFTLVNKKNALLRRQMQLNILEQEEDLSRRCELLAQELRQSLAVDEWRKTPGQKRRERLLLQELISAVNERDRLVQEMDEQEKAIADDDAIERNISQCDLKRPNNCSLQ